MRSAVGISSLRFQTLTESIELEVDLSSMDSSSFFVSFYGLRLG